MEIYIGFDPGGDKRFGWAVCSPTARSLHVRATGEAGHAEEAIRKALSKVPSTGTVVGAGIDAPLFWTECGGRDVDNLIRRAIQKLGAPSPGGTVQQINSLRGACLVQGVLVANLLHQQFPNITITESHPKALLYLLGIANKQKDAASVSLADLSEYIVCDTGYISQHERDAILGTVAALAQREKRQGWKNLFEQEKKPITPFDYQVEYWMPWDLVEERKAT
jgi:hypothetical protein